MFPATQITRISSCRLCVLLLCVSGWGEGNQAHQLYNGVCMCLSVCAARSVRQAQRQSQLEGLLTEVISHVNEKRAHIPPVVSSSPCSFPFDIEVKGGSRLSLGLDAVKRMLLHTSPPAVLS